MGRNEGAGLLGFFPASDAKKCGDGPNPAFCLVRSQAPRAGRCTGTSRRDPGGVYNPR